MKKKILFVLFVALFVFPFKVWALPDEYANYRTMNLEEVLTQEEIDHDLSNYQETDNQITIYLFRGYGCPHCKAFLEFLNSIVDEYGNKFKLVSFEVYNDQSNGSLMTEVGKFLNTSADGIPFIIIGKTHYDGYAESMDEQLKAAIDKEYANKERYDVFEEMVASANKKETSGNVNTILIILCNLIFITVASLVVIGVNNSKHNQLLDAIDELEEKIDNLGLSRYELKVKEKNKS